MLETILWIITVFCCIGSALGITEHYFNQFRIPMGERPALFSNLYIQYYQMYGALSLIIVPLFAVWKWGWWGLIAYPVYFIACALVAMVFYLIAYFVRKK